jgi:hypothetical protein
MLTAQKPRSGRCATAALPITLNLLVKKVKRCGHGFKNFEHYLLRVLLRTGGVKWDVPQAATIRARSPHLNA